MHAVLGWVLRSRLVVLLLSAGLVAVGSLQLRNAPLDVLPEFAPPYAEIQTEALGLSAEEVEQLITVPLEADLLNGVEGVRVIRSSSLPGVSSVVLVFEPGSDIYRQRQLVEERLTQAHALPHVSKPPTLLQPLSASSRVLMIGLSSRELSGIEQSVLAQWVMRPKLVGVPGVANVAIWGMRDQQLQIQVDPQQLRRQGVTLGQVVESAGNAQVVSPLTFLEASTPGTGGFVETPQQRLQVRHLIEKIADPEALGRVPVAGSSGRLRLSDVSTVNVDHQPLIGDAVVAGGPGLMMVVEKFPGADTRGVDEGVRDALETLRPGLGGMQVDTTVLRPARYVEIAAENYALVLLSGLALLLAALAALRLGWRSLLVCLVTVPLSVVVAVVVVAQLGGGLNALVMAGLAAALVVLVDEAVVATDQVHRVHREAGRHLGGPVAVIATATGRLMRPLLYATLLVLLATAPVMVMGGRPGAFFRPVVLGYAAGVLAAAVTALTVTPAMSSLLADRSRRLRRGGVEDSRLGRGYARALERFGRRRATVLGSVTILALLAVAALPFTGASPVPTFRDHDLRVELAGRPGTSNTAMTTLVRDLGARVDTLPGVAGVGAQVGRAVTGDRLTNVSSASLWVRVAEDADYDRTVAAVRSAAAAVPGVQHDVVTSSAARIRDVGGLTRGRNPGADTSLDVLTGSDERLGVRVYGQDLAALRAQAERVRATIAAVQGIRDPRVETVPEQPTIEIEVDLDEAQALGLTPGAVRRAEATLLQGIQVGSVFRDQKVFDVVVKGTAATRGGVAAVRDLLIDTPGGGHVRLGRVADVRVVSSPAVIDREAVSRYVDVVAEVAGGDAGAVTTAVEQALSRMDFPIEYHAEVLTGGTASEVGWGRVVGVAVGAVLAALLLLQALFNSWRLAALVLATLPLSLVGGLLAGLLDGPDLRLGGMLGLLAVLSLTTRSVLVLVERARSWEQSGGGEGRAASVWRAARERLAPVVATTAAVAGLMVPVLVLGTRPGLEIATPMAVVVLGGLVTSAATVLFVTPALYLHLGGSGPDATAPGVPVADRGEVTSSTNGTGPSDGLDGFPRQRPGAETGVVR
ncbi:MAG: efflux RND transporter permease subunit [Nocardioidaceae bacterium]